MNANFLRVVINYGRNVLFDDSSEDENDILEKVDNFAEYTVPNMTDKQFQMHFRMTSETFEDLLAKVHKVQLEIEEVTPRRPTFPKTPMEKEVMIMIWYLSNLESFRSVADRFGVSKSTCWDVLYRMCHVLLRVNSKYKIINWPSRERQREISLYFEQNTSFPGIIGCIDGSHIPIVAPKESHVSYINRKSYHSVLLQGVCDHRKLFTNVYAGEAGSIHDYTMYRRSDLYENILNGEIVFHDDNHIVGDLAYKLSTNLLVGFKNNGHLTNEQKNYNYCLSKARVIIENTFGLLKGRFRRLKLLETVRLDLISLLIVSACVLHNICIMNGDLLENIINVEEEVHEENRQNPMNLRDLERENENNNAIIKRNDIMNVLPLQQHV